MAKVKKILSSSIEVVPSSIIYPQKPSTFPSLEPIEEEAEEYDDD